MASFARLRHDENIHRGNDPDHGPYYAEYADADGEWHKLPSGPFNSYDEALRRLVECRVSVAGVAR